MELWKSIEGYEGLYEVSNLGRVRSIGRTIMQLNKWGYVSPRFYKGYILSPKVAYNGYYLVNLSKDNKQKMFPVHRLVAKAFIPNPDNYPCVNHKDEIKTNNMAENLEWCTQRYNVVYGTSIERRREKIIKPIAQYDLSGNLINKYKSVTEASIVTGIRQGWISNVAKYAERKKGKKFLSAKGFKFVYIY